MKEVASEGSLAHQVLDGGIRRGDDPRAEGERGMAAEAFHALLLDDAEQLPLRFERQLGDRVEVDGAGAGDLEAAGPRGDGVGEGAALVAEELRVDQRAGEGGAVDGDKRRPGAMAARVQLACNRVLAGAGLAGDEDVGIGAGEAPHLLDERPHHATVRDEARGHACG